MINASSALTGSTQNLTGLTYINNVITAATANGQFEVTIDGIYMDDPTAAILYNTYGYTVTKRTYDMGLYPSYVIGWGPAPTTTPTPSITATATLTPTPTPTTFYGVIVNYYCYNISQTDLDNATGNSGPYADYNGVVYAIVRDNGAHQIQSVTFNTSGFYLNGLTSALNIGDPQFGYYQNNVFITNGLSSVQINNGNIPCIYPTPTPTPTVTPTKTLTPTPTITVTSTHTPTPSVTPTLTPTHTVTSTPTPTPSVTPTLTPTHTTTPTPTHTVPPITYQSYDYQISGTDLALATGNTGIYSGYNGAVVAIVTNGYNCSNKTVRTFTYPYTSAGQYIEWLISPVTNVPVFGYYRNNVLVTTGLVSTQTINPTVPC